MRKGVEGGEGFDFSMQFIFWNNLFKGKNLLEQAKYFAPKIRIWHLGVLTMQKFINIALEIFKIFKIVTPTTFPMNIDTKKPDINGVKGKNGRVHPINFCISPSKNFHDVLKFRWNPFLHLPKNLLLSRSILLCLFKMFFCYQTIDKGFS